MCFSLFDHVLFHCIKEIFSSLHPLMWTFCKTMSTYLHAHMPNKRTERKHILKSMRNGRKFTLHTGTSCILIITPNMYVISDPGAERHLVSFVVRDSPMGFVAVTCWGTEKYIAEISNLYHLGDIGITKLFRILIPTAYRSEQTFLEGGDQWYSRWTNQNLTLGCWMWMIFLEVF